MTVTTPVATSATSSVDQFTYQAAGKGTPPVIGRLSPASRPTFRAYVRAHLRQGSSGATAVHFGRSKALFFDISGLFLQSRPPGTGTVDVTVTTASGTSSVSWTVVTVT